MTRNELTAKQLAEMGDMMHMQKQEIMAMDKRHDRERFSEPSPYFEGKRQQQREQLLKQHVMERARLIDMHDQEYRTFSETRSILLNAERNEKAEQLELNLQMKQQPEPEHKQNILDKVRGMFKQKTKDRQQEM